tara:strand:- start:847 stop:2037 length:1191 start_codon:yes stop_codon:yes gene_type:complete
MRKNKIKILRILNRFNIGGPIYNATYLTKYINKEKFTTLLIGGICEKHEKSAKYILKNENVDFIELKYMKRAISPIYDFFSLLKITYIIYKFRPDIIHTHAAKAGLIGRISSLFYYKKIKIVHTYHGNVFQGYFTGFINKIILIIERFLARKSTKIIAISKLQKKELVDDFSICEKNKIQIIPLGFDLARFSHNLNYKRKKIRSEFQISNNEILITIIGRVVPIKNQKFFLDVFNYCKINSNIPIKGFVIGDGPDINGLMKHAKDLGLSYNYKIIKKPYDVFFCSWRKNVDYFLSASDIVALTSKNEGTPVSIIESMASGTASISTNVGGVSDIIENEVSGIIAPNNVKEFGDALLKIISNENLRKKIGKNGKKKVLSLYNYNVLVKNTEKLYESL